MPTGVIRPRRRNQRSGLRRAGAFRARNPSMWARIDRGASELYGAAVRADGAGLALHRVFVERAARRQAPRGQCMLSIIAAQLAVTTSAVAVTTRVNRVDSA